MTMSEIDPLEADMLRGAVLALRRRADRQAKIAEAGTMLGDRGAVIGHARPLAARRELADIGEVLEAAIKFVHIERGLSCDLET